MTPSPTGTAPLLFTLIAAIAAPAAAIEPAQIKVVDDQNGWPVPLVELTTTHHVTLVTDNAGVAAFDLPELMGEPTWLTVKAHGYGVEPDGFGYEGVRVTPRPGETLKIRVKRELPGKRLGRITGAGLFGESQQRNLGDARKESGVLGCDSVQLAEHRGKLFWLWGDTTLARYPLGRFHMTGATTPLRPLDRFEPPLGIAYDFFRDADGAVRDVARMPGEGPTWLSGLVSLADADGQERLVATYSKIDPPLDSYEVGLCVWDDEHARFTPLKTLWRKSDGPPKPPPAPHGHAVRWTDESGAEWVLFGDPFPTLKCAADFDAYSDPQRWQALAPQADVASRSGRRVTPHRGSIAFNAYRGKWITVFCEQGGEPSYLGELWYAEADSPVGPWGDAQKVVTHDNYTFYNPRLHPELVDHGSPIVLFEATYTAAFAAGAEPTPRHDYNQILYRLDLDEMFGEAP
ncbi:hypothetical protein [Botrimarina sp.]|uniref:hypothetical protein n=1 Tax=Botrimarina sp. TaxID=2795802 RepID=UPI0032EF12B2